MKEQTLSGWELASSNLSFFLSFFLSILLERCKVLFYQSGARFLRCRCRDVQVDLNKKCGAKKCGAKKCGGRYEKVRQRDAKKVIPISGVLFIPIEMHNEKQHLSCPILISGYLTLTLYTNKSVEKYVNKRSLYISLTFLPICEVFVRGFPPYFWLPPTGRWSCSRARTDEEFRSSQSCTYQLLI